jgi:hypothetical protein
MYRGAARVSKPGGFRLSGVQPLPFAAELQQRDRTVSGVDVFDCQISARVATCRAETMRLQKMSSQTVAGLVKQRSDPPKTTAVESGNIEKGIRKAVSSRGP